MTETKPEVLLRVEALRGSRLLRPAGQRPVKAAAFEAVSFTVAAGERVAIVCPPGEGRLPLLRTVALLQRPEAGRIYFEGTDLTRLQGEALRRLRQRLQFVGGDPRYLIALDCTVSEALLEPLQIHRLGAPAEQRARAAAAADALDVNRLLLERKVRALSPALRQRVALARALALHPRLLLCEALIDCLEPAAASPLLETVARACRTLREPAAWVWSTTDRERALAFADRVGYFNQGRLEMGAG